MNYSADALKKEYKKNTDYLRANNLKKLREEIARLSLSDFSRETGMTKNDISLLENSEKTLSLTHMLAYKKYFAENHNIDLSMDYLMGFTDIMENNNMNYQKEIGLSDSALKALKEINKHALAIKAINTILADKEKALPLLYNIEQYISNDAWLPGLVSNFEDGDMGMVFPIDKSQNLAFYNKNGALAIDESMLKGVAMFKIQDILSKYRQE